MKTYIRSLSTTSGFLQDSSVEFSPALNCVIGARGTCKSTLIESIRFAFDHDEKKIAFLVRDGIKSGDSAGMIRATLYPGSVRCILGVEDGSDSSTITLEREVDSVPRVFVDNVREHADHAVLKQVEIYSQGDLQRIAGEANHDLRIALVDRPHAEKVEKLTRARYNTGAELIRIGQELRSLRTQILTLRQDIQPIDMLRQQLRHVQDNCPQLTPELEREQAAADERRKTLDMLANIVRLREAALETLSPVPAFQERVHSMREELAAQQEPGAGEWRTFLESISESLLSAQEASHKLAALRLEQSLSAITQEYESANETYYRLRQEQQAVNESLKQQHLLSKQIAYLSKRADELDTLRAEEAKLLSARRTARDEIASHDNEIYRLRIAEVESVNSDHGDRVHLTLGTGDAAYHNLLGSMLGGSRIRAQEEVANQIAGTFSAADLVDIVEATDSHQLANVLNRDLGQMNRVVAHLVDHVDLYKLEAVTPSPKLEITMYDEGVPKAVETLSEGQKATALLPLILRPLPYPLIFDQPEDDLDNSFIFRSLIQAVTKLKSERQIIFVTHNANIPVLGGADRVIVMSMHNPKQAANPKIGSVDQCKEEILELLEGGADAFRLREEKYHDLLAQ